MAKKDRNVELVNKPISSWGYVGLMLLYTVPVLGVIMLFIHAFKGKNINVRNFARSYFIQYILAFVLYIVLIVLVVLGLVDANMPFDTDMFPEDKAEVFGRIFGWFRV